MTTAENLNRIIKAKSDIKQAIENKGVTVGDMTIDGYAAKINEIPQEVTGGGKWVIPNGMKFGHSNLTEIDVYNMDFSNITDFSEMFAFCRNLISIDVSTLNPSNSDNIHSMYYNCENLTEIIGMGNWVTNNINDMGHLFENCENLTEIKGIENWVTNNLRYINNMFSNCYNLTSIDLSSWDLSKVSTMLALFRNCSNLTEVKMGSNIKSNVSVDYMFDNVAATGTFYYNPQYDYSKIIAQLPSTWTAVPME